MVSKEELIRPLLEWFDGVQDGDLLGEMVSTVLRLAEDQGSRGDLKILNRALRELRYAFKLFSPYRHVRKVSIFGSARTRDDELAYRQAVAFSRDMARLGFMVITGAGEGIMKAGQEGAGRERSFGVNIRLPFEQVANPYIQHDPKLLTFKYFFTRKLIFVKETDAFALFPGGFGTHDEGFEALTLSQTGKTKPMPIVFIDVPGGSYWQEWQHFVREHMLEGGFISPEDLSLFRVTDQVEEAVEEISRFYRNYHSSRYANGRLVIRLNRIPDATLIEQLNHDFADLLSEGKIGGSGALPEEESEPELFHLPRLTLAFNRQSFGRLRQMIDRLNRD